MIAQQMSISHKSLRLANYAHKVARLAMRSAEYAALIQPNAQWFWVPQFGSTQISGLVLWYDTAPDCTGLSGSGRRISNQTAMKGVPALMAWVGSHGSRLRDHSCHFRIATYRSASVVSDIGCRIHDLSKRKGPSIPCKPRLEPYLMSGSLNGQQGVLLLCDLQCTGFPLNQQSCRNVLKSAVRFCMGIHYLATAESSMTICWHCEVCCSLWASWKHI